MTDLTDRLDSKDCRTPNCIREADGDDGLCGFCRDHLAPPAPPDPRRKVIIAQLKAFHDRRGRRPRQDEMLAENDLPSTRLCHEVFGGLLSACKAAGLPSDRRHGPAPQSDSWTRDKVIQAVIDWAAVHGSPPTSNAWQSSTLDPMQWPRYTVCRHFFESWPAMLEAAGFEPHKPGGIRPTPAAAEPVIPPPEEEPMAEPEAKPFLRPAVEEQPLVRLAVAVENARDDERKARERHEETQVAVMEAIAELRDALDEAA